MSSDRLPNHPFVLLLIVFGASLAFNEPASGAEPSSDLSRGKARYEQFCSVCHGPQGLGNGLMAKAETPAAPSPAAPEVRRKKDDELFATIADGKGSGMPAWRDILTNEDIQDLLNVVAYIRVLGRLTHVSV